MEHIKFGAFMIQCNKCSRVKSLDLEDFEKINLVCSEPECKSEFTIYEGVKNGLKKVEDHIFPNSFLANEKLVLHIDVKIGYCTYVKFTEEIKKIYQITLFPNGAFSACYTNVTNNGFDIFTSLSENSEPSILGEEGKVIVIVDFKSRDYDIPWLHMLQYAFEQLRSEEYLMSILLSEIAFETYIDSTLTLGYSTLNGLDKDSISRLLKATDIPIKVNPLMHNLYGVKLGSFTNNWEKVLGMRNKIAHGTKVNTTREEAVFAYETVVDAIFHFIEGVDNFCRAKGVKEGMFYKL